MTGIFISYASEDGATAARLYDDLAKEGLLPWLDRKSLKPGSRWKREITNAIRGSRYVLVLLSSHSLTKRGYVQKEIKEALEVLDEYPESEVFLIPVRLEPCDVDHPRLRELQWIDLFRGYDQGLRRVVQLAREAGVKRIFSSEPPTARLRGDTIGLPDGSKSEPVAVVATSRESLHDMAKALAARDVSGFFAVVKDEDGTLVRAGTLVEVIEWTTHDELTMARIKVLEGELENWIGWTLSACLP